MSATPYTFGWFFRSRYYRRLIEDHRDYQIQGFKTRGPFVLDLDKVFISLRFSPQSPERLTSDILDMRSQRDGFSIWALLEISGDPSFRCAAIIGPPGSGKSTILQHLTLTFAKRAQRRYSKKVYPLVPLLLILRDHVKQIVDKPSIDLTELVEGIYPAIRSDSLKKWMFLSLSKGRCLIMFDGLDEVGDSEQRKVVGDWINRCMRTYSQSRFLVTSRPFGYLSNPIGHIRIVAEVQPFTLQEVDTFIENWYTQNEIMRRLGRDDKGVRKQARLRAHDLGKRIRSHSTLTNLSVNPLLLTMIAVVHDNRGALPGRRVELYAEICDVMLGSRQEAKGLPSVLSAAQNQRVLQALALKLMEHRVRTVDIAAGSKYISERLARVAGTEGTAEDFLLRIVNLSGLLVEREAKNFEFAHKSFQEYLAAVEIKDEGLEDILLDYLSDGWWEETIRLVAVQTSATSRLFRHMLANPTVQNLVLAYDCLNEGAELGAEERDELKEKIDAALPYRCKRALASSAGSALQRPFGQG